MPLRSKYLGGCQNCDPFLGTLHIRCRIIIGIQKRTTVLTTTHLVKRPLKGAAGGAGSPSDPLMRAQMNAP